MEEKEILLTQEGYDNLEKELEIKNFLIVCIRIGNQLMDIKLSY